MSALRPSYAPGFHVLRDGAHVSGPHAEEQDARAALYRIFRTSVSHACRHEGYAIVEIRPAFYAAISSRPFCRNHSQVPALDRGLCGGCLLG